MSVSVVRLCITYPRQNRQVRQVSSRVLGVLVETTSRFQLKATQLATLKSVAVVRMAVNTCTWSIGEARTQILGTNVEPFSKIQSHKMSQFRELFSAKIEKQRDAMFCFMVCIDFNGWTRFPCWMSARCLLNPKPSASTYRTCVVYVLYLLNLFV